MADNRFAAFQASSEFAGRAAHFLAYLQAWTPVDADLLKALVAAEAADIMRDWSVHQETLLKYYQRLDDMADSRFECAGQWYSNAHKAAMSVAERALIVIRYRLVLGGAVGKEHYLESSPLSVSFDPSLIARNWLVVRDAVAEFPAYDHSDVVSRVFRERAKLLDRSDTRLTPSEERTRFCFEQWQDGKSLKEINTALRRHPEWEHFNDEKSVRGRINSWAKRIGATPRKGQPGRRK